MPGAIDPLASPAPSAAVLSAARDGVDLLLHTSGSTGEPRALRRTAASWADSFDAVARRLGLDADAWWIPGPLSATMNLFAAAIARHSAGTWTPERGDQRLAALTPTGLQRLLAEDPDWCAGRLALVAGDGLSTALRDDARARGMDVAHYYGASELSLVAWGTCRDDLRLFDEVEAEIRDGDLWVASPWLATAPAAGTAWGSWRREGRWDTVGDRAHLDGDRLRVIGRRGGITTAGATVDLAPICDALMGQAAGPIAVLGLPHPSLGEVLAVVYSDARDVDLAGWARSHLAGPRRPRRWIHLPEFPLTTAGKTDVAAIRARVLGWTTR